MNFFENSFDFPLEPCYYCDIIDCCLEQNLTLWMSIPDILAGGSGQLPDNQERAG